MMVRRLSLAAVGVGLSLVAASPVAAHPSFAPGVDANAPLTLKGTVTQVDWVNPHSWIHLDVKNPDGTVTSWMIEGGTPNTLLRRGFSKNLLKVGTECGAYGVR